MAEFEHENKAEEDRCIQAFKDIISQRRDGKRDVAAIIIEPVNAFDNQLATPYFYRQIRRIAQQEGIPFVVDETKIGVGATGKFWAHEYWNLDDPADLVTFG
jgi:4-aminobutyrate aminotransferase/(S)-3-amino-2-methylpropionate transaminase